MRYGSGTASTKRARPKYAMRRAASMPANTTTVAPIPARTLRHAERAISLLLPAHLHHLDANAGAPVVGESQPAGRCPRQIDDHALATHGPRRPAIGDSYP